MQIRASLNDTVHGRWVILLKNSGHDPKGLLTEWINAAWQEAHKGTKKESLRGPGRPPMSFLHKQAKEKVGPEIEKLFRTSEDHWKSNPTTSVHRAAVAMQTLMDAGLFERAMEYQKSGWWMVIGPNAKPEPDWQKWLEESEAE